MTNRRVVIITGITGGLGPAVASQFAGSNSRIVAVATQLAKLTALRDELEIAEADWLSQAADLGDPMAAGAVVDAATERYGGIDVVVALAGGWRGGATVAETEPETLDQMLRVNLLTAFNICRAALPLLIKRGTGRIVTVSARAAAAGQAKSGAYAASKAALVALTQSIAAETRGTGVTANSILLSTIDTEANRKSMPKADFGRWVAPQRIAATIHFLCSEGADQVSGAAIPIYGNA